VWFKVQRGTQVQIGTKVQILTEGLVQDPEWSTSGGRRGTHFTCFAGTKLQKKEIRTHRMRAGQLRVAKEVAFASVFVLLYQQSNASECLFLERSGTAASVHARNRCNRAAT
jgi:hypothetical protein